MIEIEILNNEVEKWKAKAECLEEKVVSLNKHQKDIGRIEEIEKFKVHEETMTI